MAEQGTHKPLVGGSSPPLATPGSAPIEGRFFITRVCMPVSPNERKGNYGDNSGRAGDYS